MASTGHQGRGFRSRAAGSESGPMMALEKHPVPGPFCPLWSREVTQQETLAHVLESCWNNVHRATIHPSASFLSMVFLGSFDVSQQTLSVWLGDFLTIVFGCKLPNHTCFPFRAGSSEVCPVCRLLPVLLWFALGCFVWCFCSIWGIWPFFVRLFKAPELSHFFLSDKAPVSTEFRHFRAFLAPSGPVGTDPRSVLVYTCDPSTQGRGRMISGLGSLGNDETSSTKHSKIKMPGSF